MRKLLIPVMLALVLVLTIGCSESADAGGPYLTKDLTLTTSRTFVYLQNPLAYTTKKTAHVLALEDDLEVVAWRYVDSAWVRVLPNYITTDLAIMRSDSVMVCASGYALPIEGEFDALTIRGKVSGGACQVHAYK